MATVRRMAPAILALALTAGTDLAPAQDIILKPADDAAKPASPFLRPPGTTSDPYAPPVDWASIPPWRQTQFFGVRAQGKTFIYVVDCSGSMDGDRLTRAKREIRRSVAEMRFPQRFQIIFYNDHPRAMPGGVPQSADFASKTSFFQWLASIDAEGETDPRAAMAQALAQKPDAVFLLSDGEFPEGAVQAILKTNKAKTPIHCIDLSGHGDDLKAIAKGSGGQYVSRPSS